MSLEENSNAFILSDNFQNFNVLSDMYINIYLICHQYLLFVVSEFLFGFLRLRHFSGSLLPL